MKKTLIAMLQDLLSTQISNLPEFLQPETKPSGNKGNNGNKPPVTIGFDFSNASNYGHNNPPGIAIGLDIGSSKIVAIIGRFNAKKQIEVLGIGEAMSDGVVRGAIANITKTTEAIKLALAEAYNQSNMEVRCIDAGISGTIKNYKQHGLLIRDNLDNEISLNDIEILETDLNQLVLPPGEKIIYYAANQYIVDDVPGVKDPVGMAGLRLEADFSLITAPASTINNLHKCVFKANAHLLSSCPVPIASAEAVLYDYEKEESVAIIDFGAATTSITIFKNGVMVHADIIPLGGNSLTKDIQAFTGLVKARAESLKIEFGNALAEFVPGNLIIQIKSFKEQEAKNISQKDLAFVIQARMEELIGIANSIISASLNSEKPFYGIVLIGGGALLPNLKILTKRLTGVECHLGNPDLHLAPNAILPAEVYNNLKSPVYATSIGLLKMGLEKNNYQ